MLNTMGLNTMGLNTMGLNTMGYSGSAPGFAAEAASAPGFGAGAIPGSLVQTVKDLDRTLTTLRILEAKLFLVPAPPGSGPGVAMPVMDFGGKTLPPVQAMAEAASQLSALVAGLAISLAERL